MRSKHVVRAIGCMVLLMLATGAYADSTISISGDWSAVVGVEVTPLTESDWNALDTGFRTNMGEGQADTYYDEPTLYVYGGGTYQDGATTYDLDAGLIMAWGIELSPSVATNYIAGWQYTYGVDPNLQGQTLWMDANPPNVSPATGFVINTLGIGLVDNLGRTRSWTFNCIPGPGAGPGALARNAVNDVLIQVAAAGAGGMGDELHAALLGPPPFPNPWPPGPPPWDTAVFADNGFDPTNCVSIVGIENGLVPVGGSIVAPPLGGAGRSVWNWWGVMQVTPEPATLALLGLGAVATLIRRRRSR